MKPTLLYSLAAFAVISVMAPARAAPPDLDHYNPVLLNEYALQKLREGDVATAEILLERAVLLAPENPGIRSNLDTLKDSIAGKQLPPVGAFALEGTSSPASVQSSGGGIASAEGAPAGAIPPPPPFPLWPKDVMQ